MKKNTTLRATKRLLDSVWTIEFVINNDDTVTIARYDRTNAIGYEQERNLPSVRLVEDSKRNVIAISLNDDIELPVENVQNVFSYSA